MAATAPAGADLRWQAQLNADAKRQDALAKKPAEPHRGPTSGGAAATACELHLVATAFQPWRALLRAIDGARCGSDAAMRLSNAVTGAIGTQRRRAIAAIAQA